MTSAKAGWILSLRKAADKACTLAVTIIPHPDMAVRPCADFFQQLRKQFGKDCLTVQVKKAEARRKSDARPVDNLARGL